MNTRTEFGMHLSMSSAMVAVWAFAFYMLDDIEPVAGLFVSIVGGLFLLFGMWLVVSRGVWSSGMTSSRIRRAAFLGVAWGPAAALATVLWGHWLLAILALPVPAVVAAGVTTLWLLVPEPVRGILRYLPIFRYFP